MQVQPNDSRFEGPVETRGLFYGVTMSRSKKGKKAPGWDYWGKRPLGFGAMGKSHNKRIQKQEQIQRERTILKRELRADADEFDD